jgi:phospholipase/lecithinase/hemolysin
MLTASLLGGTDYAYGSAQTGPTAVNPTGPTNALDLPAQVTQFLASYPTAPSSALYTVAIGSNDLLGVLESANPVATAAVVVPQAVQNIDRSISTLAAAGAKDFLVLDVSDLGLTPDVEALGSVASAGATTLSTEFNTALNASVSSLATADGLDLTIFNLQALTDAVVNDPAAYGFTNVTQPCFTGTATGGPSSGTLCGTSLAEQDEYLYWDGLHPTAAGQAGIAAGAEQAIPEPGAFVLLLSGLSFLLVTCRLSRCASTQRRISANL